MTGHDLVPGSTIRIEFDGDGHLRADAGCNGMSGELRWDGPHLSVEQLMSTEMGCEQPLMDQDRWFAGVLRSGLHVYLAGDALTLTGQGVTLRFIDRRTADPDRPLEGTAWTLDGIIAGDGPSGSVSSVPRGITATLRIVGGRIHFFDGRSDYDGAATVATNTVRIQGQITSSAVGCASGSTCSVDMSVLTDDFDYQITANHLTVTGAGGAGLRFVTHDQASDTPTAPPRSP